MRLADQLRNIRHTFSANRARSALTLLGIVIGSGSIVMLASLLHGGQEALVMTSQRANESDLIAINTDEPPLKQAHKTRRELSLRDADNLGDSPLLQGAPVASETARESRISWPKKKNVRIVGATSETLSLYHLEIERGRGLGPDDLSGRRRVCVLGQEVWRDVFEANPDVIGQTILAEGQLWIVVGILKNKPTMGGGGDGTWMWNRKLLIPQPTFDALFNTAHTVQRIFVRTRSTPTLGQRLAAVQSVIRTTLLRRHLGVENFKINGDENERNQTELILMIIKMLLLGTGLLSLFVGGINIMNIMLVTVTERTREIGIRRAIGAPPSSILIQFLLEASFIALSGGLIGVLGGVAVAWLIAVLLGHLLGAWSLHIEPWSVALGLGLSLTIGLTFGLFPAWRAARLNPVEALRFE